MPWPAAAGCPAPARQPLDQGRARHGASPACQPSSGPLLSPEGLRDEGALLCPPSLPSAWAQQPSCVSRQGRLSHACI